MRARAPASPETRPASVTAGVRAGWAARLSRSRDIRGSNACRMLSADGQRRPGAGSVAAITQRDFTRRPGGGEFALPNIHVLHLGDLQRRGRADYLFGASAEPILVVCSRSLCDRHNPWQPCAVLAT